jgi:hypothetical protein
MSSFKERNYGPQTPCCFLVLDGHPKHLLFDWCFFSLPGQGRSEGRKLPSHNVMFWVFRQQVMARRYFLGNGCAAIHSERPGMHLFSITFKYPLFTVA